MSCSVQSGWNFNVPPGRGTRRVPRDPQLSHQGVPKTLQVSMVLCGTVPVEMHGRGSQTPHRCSRTLVLACTRDIDVWEAGAIWEAQRGPPLQGALGHGDRRDWRGVNREVGWAGGCGRFARPLYRVRTSVPSAGTLHYPALRTAERNHLVKATGSGVFFLLVGPETGKGLQGSIRLGRPQALEAKSRSRDFTHYNREHREKLVHPMYYSCYVRTVYVDASFVAAN